LYRFDAVKALSLCSTGKLAVRPVIHAHDFFLLLLNGGPQLALTVHRPDRLQLQLQKGSVCNTRSLRDPVYRLYRSQIRDFNKT
jgi:hypothetical protein